MSNQERDDTGAKEKSKKLDFRSEITQAQEFDYSYRPSMKDVEDIKKKLRSLGVEIN